MTPERTIRRWVRLYPRRWRARYEDEVVGTLLDATGPGRRVALADRLDLGRGAVAAWWRTVPAVAWAFVGAVLFVVLGVAATGGRMQPEFLATSAVVVAVPGTGVVYTVSCALGGGWRAGALAATGCTLGIVPHLGAAVVGVSGLMHAGATLFEIVRWIGVAYLVVMGLSMMRGGGALRVAPDRTVDGAAASGGGGAIVGRGIALNLLNPKLTVFFLAFLPQFLDAPTTFDPRLVGLGLVFMAITLIGFLAYAAAGATFRDRVLAEPRVVEWAQRTLGVVLVGFAARLATIDR